MTDPYSTSGTHYLKAITKHQERLRQYAHICF